MLAAHSRVLYLIRCMATAVRVGCAVLGLAFGAGLAAACGAGAVSPSYVDAALPDVKHADAGCYLLKAFADPGGCLAEWACTDAAALSLACGPIDSGRTCFCIVADGELGDEGQRGGRRFPKDPCADGGLTAAALQACGWAVPP